MKFRCNICVADPDSATYNVFADTWDGGMQALQTHINIFHGGGEAVVEDVTLNIRPR